MMIIKVKVPYDQVRAMLEVILEADHIPIKGVTVIDEYHDDDSDEPTEAEIERILTPQNIKTA